MLRWRLSTVRALGGHDSYPRLFSYTTPQTLRLSRFSHADAAAPIIGLAEEPDTPVAASSSAESYLTGSENAFRLPLKHATDLSGVHRPRRAAPSRTSHPAIDILMQFLSPENVASDQPLIYPPTTVRSLYYRAESMNQLDRLDSKKLTLLIGLFGSLSIDPRIPTVYRVPLASRLLEVSARRTHWAFVLKVGKYKLERGITLQDSDRFWLMRAELAIVQARSPLEPLSGNTYSVILRARTHYHIIRRHSRCPEVHAGYLESLLAIRDPRLLDLAACDLSFLLRTHRVCRPWLQHLLYRLVIRHGFSLSSRSQEAILSALWSRVYRGTDDTSGLVSENSLSGVALDNCIWDATTLARSISTTLFSFAGYLPNDKSANAFGHLFSVFSPVHALPMRWSSLLSFSIFNSPRVSHFDGIWWTGDLAMPQVVSCWQVIFGLATAEKLSQEESTAPAMQPTPPEEVMNTTRTLFQLWLPNIESCPVPRDLACAIATSFLGMAGVLADATLFHHCQDLYHVENRLEGPPTSMQKFFTARYIAAAVRIQGPLPDVVCTALTVFSPDLKQQYQVLASAVEYLAPMDPTLAYTLYIVAQGKEMEPDTQAVHTMAMSFARHGALHQAILILSDSRISLAKRGILISAIARSLRKNPRTRHPPSVFVAIVNELATLYHSHVPPRHFRGHLEQLVIVLARHGRGSQLFPVVLSIFRNSPSFFQPRFFVRYCHVLVRHRQFVSASKLLDVIGPKHPRITRFLRILTDRVAPQTKAFRVFRRATRLRGPMSLKLTSRLRRWPRAGPPLERSLQELLRSRRLLAAKHIFARAAAALPSRRRTTLGNILLYGVSRQPTPRNGRRVCKVFALLENLVKNHGFQPDRVTANILVKVLINWRSAFDSQRLRELFDQFVRGGYPVADYSPLHPPFGTRQTQFPGSSGISRLPPFVSFEKHARPLFKMFIKAFYSCNDVEAARKVVGILKVEGYKHAVAKGARQEARRRGSIKAAQRNVIPLDPTVP